MSDTALVFNALSGTELLEVVVSKIRATLLATGEFDSHVSFPWVKFDYHVGLVVYPKQSVDAEPGIVAKGEVTLGDPADAPAPEDELKEIKVQDTQIVDTPDLARIESEQPIPTPARGAGNVLVDKMVTPVAQTAERRPFGYKGTDGKGKTSGTGNQSAS